MGELFDQFVIELKNLAKTLKIEEIKEEHHSVPYAPRGHVSQVLTKGKVGKEPRSIIDFSLSPYTLQEHDYISRVEDPLWMWRR